MRKYLEDKKGYFNGDRWQVVNRAKCNGLQDADAEDAVQDAIVALLTQNQLDECSIKSPIAVLTQMTIWKSLDRQRHLGRKREILADIDWDRIAQPDDSPCRLVHDEDLNDLRTRLKSIPFKQREAVWLINAKGISASKIGKKRGVTGRAICARNHRGLQALRSMYGLNEFGSPVPNPEHRRQ